MTWPCISTSILNVKPCKINATPKRKLSQHSSCLMEQLQLSSNFCALPKSLLSQHDSTSCLLVMLSQYSDGEVCGPQCFGSSQGFCVLHLLFPCMSSWCAVAHSVLLKDSCFLCYAGSLYFCCYCCMSENLILCLWMYLKGVMLHFLYAGLFVLCSLITHIQQLFWYNL